MHWGALYDAYFSFANWNLLWYAAIATAMLGWRHLLDREVAPFTVAIASGLLFLFIGFAFTHANSVAVPHGGQRAFFGTNPISFAFPREGHEPLCLDMATTSIPWNRVRNARREGHALPPDVAVDAQGAPTTDANAAAAVVPLGGSEFGHKGYALALVIDLLCGPLLGNPYGPHIPPMFEAIDEPRQLGAFFIALDPERFAGGAALSAQIEAMAAARLAKPPLAKARSRLSVAAAWP